MHPRLMKKIAAIHKMTLLWHTLGITLGKKTDINKYMVSSVTSRVI